MLKKIPTDKTNVTKNALFFLSQTSALHSFTFKFAILTQAEAQGSSL